MRFLKAYINLITKFNDAAGRYFICWLIYVLIAIMVIVVARRYFFHRPVTWGLDMTWMIYSAFIFLGGAYALVHDAHVSVDLIYNRFSVRVRAFLSMMGYLILFFPAFYFLSEYTFYFALKAYTTGETSPYALWKPAVWPIKFVLFISMVLLLLQGIAKFFEHLIIFLKGGAECPPSS